jgi:hypothetical protein
MIRRSLMILSAVALMASFSHAQLTDKAPSFLVKTPSSPITLPLVANPRDAVTNISIAGVNSFDSLGAPLNETISSDLGALLGTPGGPVRVTGIGWDATIETVGASWLSEAVIDFDGAVFLTMGVGDDFPSPPGGTNYSSPIVDLIGLGLDFVAGDGILDLEFFESFDDNLNAIDARYLTGSLTIEFEASQPPQPPVAMDLGVIATINDVVIVNTRGSDFDTELGVYNSAGALLATNDDIDLFGGDFDSEIVLGTLPVGTYYTALGGFNTIYGGGFGVTGGSSAGNYEFNYNGGAMPGVLAANAVKWFSFQVVPEPTSISLILCGIGLLAARRR